MSDALLAKIRKSLADSEPTKRGLRFASVAMILRNEAKPEVLLIKRAESVGDPWSGQIAFPGGKMQRDERTVKDTAMRETLEEVGIDLNKVADFLGYGTLTTTHTGNMDVVPTVFMLKNEAEARTNEEVASYRWVELEVLLSPKATTSYHLNTPGGALELPAYAVGDYVVWGLTYRILNSLLGYK